MYALTIGIRRRKLDRKVEEKGIRGVMLFEMHSEKGY